MSADLDGQLARVAALAEPIRRALYRYVIAARRPVSREQAATGVGVAHHVAKFHLDKLEEDGLLEAEYARPPGRGGPGAGRPAKLYRRAAGEIAVTVPERHYELAARVLAEAVTQAARSDGSVAVAVTEAAFDAGRTLVAGAGRGRPALLRTLAANGYEPAESGASITLTNCPFHALAAEHVDLVCGLNLDLVRGMIDGVAARGLQASLNPAHHGCCVEIT